MNKNLKTVIPLDSTVMPYLMYLSVIVQYMKMYYGLYRTAWHYHGIMWLHHCTMLQPQYIFLCFHLWYSPVVYFPVRVGLSWCQWRVLSQSAISTSIYLTSCGPTFTSQPMSFCSLYGLCRWKMAAKLVDCVSFHPAGLWEPRCSVGGFPLQERMSTHERTISECQALVCVGRHIS